MFHQFPILFCNFQIEFSNWVSGNIPEMVGKWSLFLKMACSFTITIIKDGITASPKLPYKEIAGRMPDMDFFFLTKYTSNIPVINKLISQIIQYVEYSPDYIVQVKSKPNWNYFKILFFQCRYHWGMRKVWVNGTKAWDPSGLVL